MKTISNFQARWLSILFIFTVTVIIIGCDSYPPIGHSQQTYSYRVEAVLVNNLNADWFVDVIMGDTARIAVRVERNDSLLGTATVTFDTTVLLFDRPTFVFNEMYSFAAGPTALIDDDTYSLGLVDSARFGDTLTMVVPDTFQIDVYTNGEDSVNVGGEAMQLAWFSGADVEGYVVAVVLEDSVNTGYGYSQYVTSLTTEATIPLDAFRLESGIGGEPDTGWYRIFVYGYTGNPDSTLSSRLLPVPLPSNLDDNVDLEDLTGKLGVVNVTRHVRVHVVAQ